MVRMIKGTKHGFEFKVIILVEVSRLHSAGLGGKHNTIAGIGNLFNKIPQPIGRTANMIFARASKLP